VKHPYVVTWLAEGCVVQPLPTPRGKRNALLLNRGVVTAILRLSEDDYLELVAAGQVSATTKELGHERSADGSRHNGRGARDGTAS
jgi:hypothetical protein